MRVDLVWRVSQTHPHLFSQLLFSTLEYSLGITTHHTMSLWGCYTILLKTVSSWSPWSPYVSIFCVKSYCDQIKICVRLTQFAVTCNLAAHWNSPSPQESKIFKSVNSLVADGSQVVRSVHVPACDTLNSSHLVSNYDNLQDWSQNVLVEM